MYAPPYVIWPNPGDFAAGRYDEVLLEGRYLKDLALDPQTTTGRSVRSLNSSGPVHSGPRTRVHCLAQSLSDRAHASWRYMSRAFQMKGVGFGLNPHGGYKSTVLVESEGLRHFIVAHMSPFFAKYCGRGEACKLLRASDFEGSGPLQIPFATDRAPCYWWTDCGSDYGLC